MRRCQVARYFWRADMATVGNPGHGLRLETLSVADTAVSTGNLFHKKQECHNIFVNVSFKRYRIGVETSPRLSEEWLALDSNKAITLSTLILQLPPFIFFLKLLAQPGLRFGVEVRDLVLRSLLGESVNSI